MENVVQLNPYVNMSFDQLMKASSVALRDDIIDSSLIQELKRRLAIKLEEEV